MSDDGGGGLTAYDDFEKYQEFLEERTLEELEEDVVDMEDWQLFIYEAVAERHDVKRLINAEIEYRNDERDNRVFTPDEGDEVDYSEYADEEDDDDDSQAVVETAEVWDSGLEVLTSFDELAEELIGAKSLEQYAKRELGISKNKIIVPDEVRRVCVALQEEMGGTSGSEWGALFKGEWTDEGFKVYNDYVVPEQKVSRATVKYQEDLKKYREQGYIVNVHSHPFSGENAGFSGTDDEHVNSQFEVALLYGGKAENIVNGIANLDIDNGVKVQISPEIEVETPERNLPDVETDNIEKISKNRKRSSYSSGKSFSGSRSSYSYGRGRGYYGSSSTRQASLDEGGGEDKYESDKYSVQSFRTWEVDDPQ